MKTLYSVTTYDDNGLITLYKEYTSRAWAERFYNKITATAPRVALHEEGYYIDDLNTMFKPHEYLIKSHGEPVRSEPRIEATPEELKSIVLNFMNA